MRRARRPVGRGQELDPEDDLRHLPLRRRQHPSACRWRHGRRRPGGAAPDSRAARACARLCQPVSARRSTRADARCRCRAASDRGSGACRRPAARSRSPAPAQHTGAAVAAAAGDVLGRRTAARQHRPRLHIRSAAAPARRAYRLARRRQPRRRRRSGGREKAARNGGGRDRARRRRARGDRRHRHRRQPFHGGGLRKPMAHRDLLLANARVVLPGRGMEAGWGAAVNGGIVEIGEGRAPDQAEDLAGDLLLPGLVELHTDHLEAHYVPRPKVHWDPVAAVVSYDGQLATCGITTALDSLRVWREEGTEDVDGQAEILADAIAIARDADLLRLEHFLHLRCEVPMPSVVAETKALIERADVRLVSLMEHTPGQRQFRDEGKLRDYYRGKNGGMTDAELDVLFAKRIAYQAAHAETNHRDLVGLARARNVPLAIRDGVALAEFPTTVEAAQALHAAGIRVLMGAPNLVRGGSHAGNIATQELARAGALDVLSSDYVPASLLMAALRLPQAVADIELPAAVRMVSKTPAEAVGLSDRGEIAVGKRADLIRVRVVRDVPAVRSIWRGGRRVA